MLGGEQGLGHGAPPTRLKRLDFIQGLMGATGRDAATFRKDPSRGSIAGAKEAVGRMDAPSRPEVGPTVDSERQGDTEVPGWVLSPDRESSERDCTLESGKFGLPLTPPAQVTRWFLLALTVNPHPYPSLASQPPRGSGLGP